MKKIALALVLVTSGAASAAVLNCWDQDLLNARRPLFSAEIVNHSRLKNIQFNYRGDESLSNPGVLRGKMNNKERSPYKGLNEYSGIGAGDRINRLILPPDLSNANLDAVKRRGLVNPGENGVVILYGHNGLSHLTKRLVCFSDL